MTIRALRCFATGMLMLAGAGCAKSDTDVGNADSGGTVTVAFDGADYQDDSGKVAHGQRIATLFQCSGCHGTNYSGSDFGVMFPVVKGLWASNISRVIPTMSDSVLERLLRERIHPDREIYIMPAKQTQFLSERDMTALIAFLRTIPPVGEPTPLPPPGFEAAVTARLPDDYWRTLKDGEKRGYHNSAEEVAYYAENQPPDLGKQFARGRMIASSLCSGCHGAALDGVGEPSGSIQGALAYDDAAFDRLLVESINRDGKKVAMEFGFGHEATQFTPAERRDVIAYIRALARQRAH
jgi:mono/diheme cytochrome c family protein